MEHIIRRRCFLIYGGALVLTACDSGEVMTWEPETGSEKQLRESREALQRTVGEGALIGAAAGAAIGALIDGSEGGFRGAQIGFVAGVTAGSYVKSLQQKYSQQERLLTEVISDLQRTNARMEDSLRAMRAALKEKQNRPQPDATRDARLSREAAATLQVGENYNELFSETRSILSSQGYQTSSMNQEMATLSKRISEMRSVAEALAVDL
ncbi:hypothetical protein [uncultured Shimia sp.]|uniref:hypothetical protein n=1 Tax=uncultured Shimia sp. TaxID=573152 RepID=UPI0026394C2B|nr:hypothetical protein [uncultured Shimia sp.]